MKLTAEERVARQRAAHTEWQRKNKDKVKEYRDRYIRKKAEQIAKEMLKEQRGERNEQVGS